ncbi:MAG: hypothetical protein R6X33_05155 [Candidatus Brocadiia bacterium]
MDREQRVELAVRVAGIVILSLNVFNLLTKDTSADPFLTRRTGLVLPILLGAALACFSGRISRFLTRSEAEPPYTQDNLKLGCIFLSVHYGVFLLGGVLAQPNGLPKMLPELIVGVGFCLVLALGARSLAAKFQAMRPDEAGIGRQTLGATLPLIGINASFAALLGIVAAVSSVFRGWTGGPLGGGGECSALDGWRQRAFCHPHSRNRAEPMVAVAVPGR